MIKSTQQHLVKDKESGRPALLGNHISFDREIELILMFGDGRARLPYKIYDYAKHQYYTRQIIC